MLYAQWVPSGGVTKEFVGDSAGSYKSDDQVLYVVSYTIPSGIGSEVSFKIVDEWLPVDGLAFESATVSIVGGGVLSDVTVDDGTGWVTVTFDSSAVSAHDVVEVIFTFTVTDVSVGISNFATVNINGQFIDVDTVDLYVVTYSDGGSSGSVPVDATLYELGESVVVLGVGDLELDGYSFIGWLYNGVIYNEGSTFAIDEDAVLVAQWVASGGVAKIFAGSAGSYGVGEPIMYGVSYTVPSDFSSVESFEIIDVWDPAGGLTFGSAVVMIDGSVVSAPVVNVSAVVGRVSFVFDPAVLLVDVDVEITLSFTIATVVSGISNTAEVVINGVSVGEAEADLYRVTYSADGATGSVPVDALLYESGVSVTVMGPGDLALDGYTFSGWLYNGTVYGAGDIFTIDEDVVLSAVWAIGPISNVYDIIYVLEGGVNAPGNPVSYITSELPRGIADPTRDDHVFAGWLVVYADGSEVTSQFSYTIPVGTVGDIVLTAVWDAVAEIRYSVIYNGNGHTGGTAPVDSNSPYVGGSQVTVLGQGSLSRSGYTFIGWATSSNTNTVTYTAGSTFTINADTFLYAVWRQTSSQSDQTPSPSYYTVTYLPGAHGTFAVQTTRNLAYGVLTPVAPQVSGELGWKFVGWSPVPSTTVRGDAVYVAQWVQEQSALLTVQFVN